MDKSGANLAALDALKAERLTPIKVCQNKYLNTRYNPFPTFGAKIAANFRRLPTPSRLFGINCMPFGGSRPSHQSLSDPCSNTSPYVIFHATACSNFPLTLTI